jgi:hypothetical protein
METQVQELHPDLVAALSVLPDHFVGVSLRGHDVTFYPVDVDHYVALSLKDPDVMLAGFGVHIATGTAGTPEEIAAARKRIPVASAAILIRLSTRNPQMLDLAKNMTQFERDRCLSAVFKVTCGGDVAGFFAEARRRTEAAIVLVTKLQNERSSKTGPGANSSTGTRSPSFSRPSRTSRRK